MPYNFTPSSSLAVAATAAQASQYNALRSDLLAYGQFGGTGVDSALTIASGTTNIDCGGAQVLVKNYTSISITGTGALTFSNAAANGTLIVLRSLGNVTLTSSAAITIDASGMGAIYGTGTANNNGNPGSAGTTSPSVTIGGGNGGVANNTTALASASTVGMNKVISTFATIYTGIFCGGGGGGGGSGTNGSGGNGGRGGGGLIIECGGALNFGASATISVAGLAGANGTFVSQVQGGGGGGGGGCFLCVYNTLTTNAGAVTVTGGTGGVGHANSAGTGGSGSVNSTTSSTGTGSTGGVGLSSIVANLNFV